MSEWMSRLIAKYSEVNEKMDPVDKAELKGKHKDRKDKDIDNDGDVDSSDKYLHKRRKAVSKAVDEEKCKECDCDDCECEKNEAYDEPQGQAKRLMSPLQKARMDKEKADRDKDGKLKKEENLDEISLDKAKSAYYKRKSQAQGAAAQGSMSYAKNQMAKARKTKAYIDRRESVEEAVELDEISKDKAQSYYSKASRSQDAAMSKMIKSRPGSPDHKSAQKTLRKRVSGLKKAADRLDPMKKEENLDEISVGKVMKYGKAAAKDIEKNRNTVKTALDQPASPKKAEAGLKSMKTLRKRSRGSDMYVNKMTGRSKVKPTAEAYENIKKATHQGPSSPPGEGLSPSAKDQLAKKMPTPEPIDEPKVDAKNFATFRKGLKAAPKRPGDNNKGDKNVVK
jgi:hypothetical protein